MGVFFFFAEEKVEEAQKIEIFAGFEVAYLKIYIQYKNVFGRFNNSLCSGHSVW
jgi:hypothetical protein